jgi:peptidoglycan-N-acetylglucosamine deacetylase
VLLLLGGAVFAARTLDRQDATGAGGVPPTATVAATRAAPAALAPTPTVVLVAEARKLEAPTATPVRARTLPTPTATRVRASAATPTPRAAPPTATPPHAIMPTLVTTVVVASASSPTPQPAAASTPPPQSARTGPAVALTFDAGADRGYAEDILDRLAEEHVVASFGITGNWAKANPDLVRRMAADGHLVFNHTLDHRSFTGLSDSLGGLSAAARRAELDQADAIIAPLIGHTTRPFYRLPYGDDDARVASDVGPDGYSHKVGWTVDSLGWRGIALQEIVSRCLKLAAPGGVYVMHVGRASQDGPALPQVIAGLRERGFSFARVDAL